MRLNANKSNFRIALTPTLPAESGLLFPSRKAKKSQQRTPSRCPEQSPGVNFINILRAPFSEENALCSSSLLTGVNFINILHNVFTCMDSKSTRKDQQLDCIFCTFGIARVKSFHKMLMKLTPVYSFECNFFGERTLAQKLLVKCW